MSVLLTSVGESMGRVLGAVKECQQSGAQLQEAVQTCLSETGRKMDAVGDVLLCVHHLSLAMESRLNQVPLMMLFQPPARTDTGTLFDRAKKLAGQAKALLVEEFRIWFLCGLSFRTAPSGPSAEGYATRLNTALLNHRNSPRIH